MVLLPKHLLKEDSLASALRLASIVVILTTQLTSNLNSPLSILPDRALSSTPAPARPGASLTPYGRLILVGLTCSASLPADGEPVRLNPPLTLPPVLALTRIPSSDPSHRPGHSKSPPATVPFWYAPSGPPGCKHSDSWVPIVLGMYFLPSSGLLSVWSRRDSIHVISFDSHRFH
ncbi:hypothetical protein LIER_24868 [Lithospermum erythrorhizon]|uniref:Uncharacterized protein n=1 Tax=Lithospermum erythrorhizon TaxID=34254 RepID=A0AAV3R5Z7_LITER